VRVPQPDHGSDLRRVKKKYDFWIEKRLRSEGVNCLKCVMNRSVLLKMTGERAGVSAAEAGRILDAALHTIQEAIARGERVSLTGFGTFNLVERSARIARIPGREKPVAVPHRKIVRFRAGNDLKAAIGS